MSVTPAIMRVRSKTGKVLWNQKVSNEQRAIEQLIARADKVAEPVRWAIDLTSPLALMLTVLLGAGQSVVYVPGRIVNTMTGAFRGEGKTDAKDARVIAETARMRSDLNNVTMPDELVVELTQLTGYRTDLMADWVRGINRLRALLGSIFPTLEAAFDYSTRSPLILVAGLCTAEIRAAGIEGVTAHVVENQAWPAGITKTAATAVTLADQQDVALPGEAGTAELIKRLARKLLDSTARSKTSTKRSPNASASIRMRGSSSRCPASDPTSARNSWWLPAGTWHPSPPLAYWRPTPDWCLCQGIRAASAGTCTGRNAAIADFGGCSTWPRQRALQAVL
jgi:Transposase